MLRKKKYLHNIQECLEENEKKKTFVLNMINYDDSSDFDKYYLDRDNFSDVKDKPKLG